MDIGALLVESLKLMALGMGFVFSLLGIIVLAIRLLARLAAEPLAPADAAGLPPSASSPPEQLHPRLVAAITAAVHRFRHPRS